MAKILGGKIYVSDEIVSEEVQQKLAKTMWGLAVVDKTSDRVFFKDMRNKESSVEKWKVARGIKRFEAAVKRMLEDKFGITVLA